MISHIQLSRYIRQILSAVEYHWESMGTLYDLSPNIPRLPGVYKIVSDDAEYIGRAVAKGGLSKRIKRHLSNPHKEWRKVDDRKRFRVSIFPTDDTKEGRALAVIIEAYLLFVECPSINIQGKR